VKSGRPLSHYASLLAILCLVSGWWYAAGIASTGYVGLHLGPTDDFFSFWNPSRALLHHQDPYSLEVAEQTQVFTYGALARDVGLANNLRLAYPIAGMFPLLPFGLLPFRTADRIALSLFAALVALSIPWIRGKWDRKTLLYIVLTFSSYPVILALQMRQPTLFYFGLIAASFKLLRSGKVTWAGIFAALAAGKPQIAIPVLLPMIIWSVAEWRERKKFVIALCGSVLAMIVASVLVVPGWIPRWIYSLREYASYVHPSVNVATFGAKAGAAVSAVLVAVLCVVLWSRRDADLWSQAALSVAIFSVVIQAEPYNLVLLLVPALWIADNTANILASGEPAGLAIALVRVAFVELWLANVVGILLLHSSPRARSMAMSLGIVAAFPVLASLMLVMLIFSGRKWFSKLGSSLNASTL